MISIGIDPGTTRIGYGVIEYDGSKFKALDYGLLDIGLNSKEDRLILTEKALNDLLIKYQPDVVGLEKIFFFKNQKTIIGVAEVRGIISLSILKKGVALIEPTPLEVKSGISGYGRADKIQVQRMVELILDSPIQGRMVDDIYDALAIAIYSANNYTPSIREKK